MVRKVSIEQLRSVDYQGLLRDFKGLDPNDPGQWPILPRVTLLIALFLAIVEGSPTRYPAEEPRENALGLKKPDLTAGKDLPPPPKKD